MERMTSSRRGKAFRGFSGIAALLLAGAALGLAGCGNDNPADSGGTMTVDVRGLVDSMGGGGEGFSTNAVGVSDSPATTSVKSLVIGAVVITFTSTPVSGDSKIDGDLADKLASDVINSINYFSIVDLPTAADFVEFKVPPPGAGNWQVAAIGTRNKIATFQDLDDDNVGIYYGFSDGFFQTSGSTGPDVTLTMKRACFIDNPPKGCAAIDDDGTFVVTPTVTILDVLDNGTPMGGGMAAALGTGIQVNSGNASSTASTLSAQLSPVSGHTYTVVMTHPNAPGQSSCSTLTRATYNLNDSTCIGTAATKF